jgi:hypothetical protein
MVRGGGNYNLMQADFDISFQIFFAAASTQMVLAWA